MAHSEVVAETNEYRVRLELDMDPAFNPREDYDNVSGAVTVPNNRYYDVPQPGPLEDAWSRLSHDPYAWNGIKDNAVENFERYVRVFHDGVTVYDSRNDGPAAVWYVTPEMMKAAGWTAEQITEDKMREVIESERKEYRAWAEGDVWGYTVEQKVKWQKATETDFADDEMETWEAVDSCWGFIGWEYAEQEAREALSRYTES